MPKKFDLTGQKFNRLTALKPGSNKGKNGTQTTWECLCECGNTTTVATDKLKSGSTKSCGCLLIEQGLEKAKLMNAVWTKYTPIEASARRIWGKRYSDMPFEDFLPMSQLPCYYCGALPNNCQNDGASSPFASQKAKEEGFFTYNGLDRVDNNLPHSKENCVPCCFDCNSAKSDQTVEEFKTWILAVATNLKIDGLGSK